METLTSVDVEHWTVENRHFADYLDDFGQHVPDELRHQQQLMAEELKKAS